MYCTCVYCSIKLSILPIYQNNGPTAHRQIFVRLGTKSTLANSVRQFRITMPPGKGPLARGLESVGDLEDLVGDGKLL